MHIHPITLSLRTLNATECMTGIMLCLSASSWNTLLDACTRDTPQGTSKMAVAIYVCWKSVRSDGVIYTNIVLTTISRVTRVMECVTPLGPGSSRHRTCSPAQCRSFSQRNGQILRWSRMNVMKEAISRWGDGVRYWRNADLRYILFKAQRAGIISIDKQGWEVYVPSGRTGSPDFKISASSTTATDPAIGLVISSV